MSILHQRSSERIMSIDPHSAREHAWLLSENTKYRHGEADLITLYHILCDPVLQPDIVLIEDQFVGINKKTALALASAKGEIVGVCKVLMIPKIILINPLNWLRYHGLHAQQKCYSKAYAKALRKKVEKIIRSNNPCIQNSFFILQYYLGREKHNGHSESATTTIKI